MSAISVPANRTRLNEYGSITAPNLDDNWSIENFSQNFSVKIFNIQELISEFDLIGIDPSVVNAFRRILISEVPTMAVDKVLMYNNTSMLADEVLAHRIGLVPIKADPRLFEYRQEGDEEGTEEDTIEFELKLKCTKNLHTPKDACSADALYCNHIVHSGDLKFIPRGNQLEMYGHLRPVYEDILLAKLRPGQEIELRAHAVKGIGRDHAKFSPVAPAYYRLMPEIKILRDVVDEQAHRLAQCFSEGVIEVVNKNGKDVARVANVRKDTGSRNIYHHDDLKDAVCMNKVKDHFIFTVESTGILPPDVLFLEGVGVLKEKCRYFLKELQTLKIDKK